MMSWSETSSSRCRRWRRPKPKLRNIRTPPSHRASPRLRRSSSPSCQTTIHGGAGRSTYRQTSSSISFWPFTQRPSAPKSTACGGERRWIRKDTRHRAVSFFRQGSANGRRHPLTSQCSAICRMRLLQRNSGGRPLATRVADGQYRRTGRQIRASMSQAWLSASLRAMPRVQTDAGFPA